MIFLLRREVPTLKELYYLTCVFMHGGVCKIRRTGAESLVRKNVLQLSELFARHLECGDPNEVNLTANGTFVAHNTEALFATGMHRVNGSLDSLDAARYARITRRRIGHGAEEDRWTHLPQVSR